MIGYAKFINQDKLILYRGETKPHNNYQPALFRDVNSQQKAWSQLKRKINEALQDMEFCKFIFSEAGHQYKEQQMKEKILEAVFQHYGLSTTCLDVVDNHWIALWFGLNVFTTSKHKNISGKYATYKPRIKTNTDLVQLMFESYYDAGKMTDRYQYIILFAVDSFNKGEAISKNTITAMDLRSFVPSNFLRPHAQHGWMLYKNKKELPNNDTEGFNNAVIGILRIRVADALNWIGKGELLSYRNLFPSPRVDQGYDVLLSKTKKNSFLESGDIILYD